jgi:hypothetical protein
MKDTERYITIRRCSLIEKNGKKRINLPETVDLDTFGFELFEDGCLYALKILLGSTNELVEKFREYQKDPAHPEYEAVCALFRIYYLNGMDISSNSYDISDRAIQEGGVMAYKLWCALRDKGIICDYCSWDFGEEGFDVATVEDTEFHKDKYAIETLLEFCILGHDYQKKYSQP